LCDQHGAASAPRGYWVDCDGPSARRFRFNHGWCHPRRYGRFLSRCRRPATQFGGV
jgi:hypothetical protein